MQLARNIVAQLQTMAGSKPAIMISKHVAINMDRDAVNVAPQSVLRWVAAVAFSGKMRDYAPTSTAQAAQNAPDAANSTENTNVPTMRKAS